jgi:hypothetical protein
MLTAATLESVLEFAFVVVKRPVELPVTAKPLKLLKEIFAATVLESVPAAPRV